MPPPRKPLDRVTSCCGPPAHLLTMFMASGFVRRTRRPPADVVLRHPKPRTAKSGSGARLADELLRDEVHGRGVRPRTTCGSACERRTTPPGTIRSSLQFSDSVSATGESTLRIGSTSSAEVTLQNGPTARACKAGAGATTAGARWVLRSTLPPTAHTSCGSSSAEDGAAIDQIVLSPVDVQRRRRRVPLPSDTQDSAPRPGSRAERVGRDVGDSSRLSRCRTNFRNVADHFRRDRRRVASASQPGSGRHHD